jgi:hypothetical protein
MNITNRKIFVVNSRNGIEGTDEKFSFTFEIPKNEKYDRVCVLSAIIPKSYYLIQSGKNTFTLSENGTNTVITVPPGNYSRRQFQAKITTLLNAGTAHAYTYAISVPNTTTGGDDGKYTYTVTGNGGVQPSFIFTTYLYEQFGFAINSTATFAASSLISDNVVKFQLEDALLIHSDIAINDNNDVLQDIFVDNGDFSSIKFINFAPEAYSKQLALQGKSNVYHFTLTNEDGDIMNLNGLNIVLTILIWKENDIWDYINKSIKHFIRTQDIADSKEEKTSTV